MIYNNFLTFLLKLCKNFKKEKITFPKKKPFFNPQKINRKKISNFLKKISLLKNVHMGQK